MSNSLERLKTELERFGRAHDSSIEDHSHRMLNITRDTGEFVYLLIHLMVARRVLEIGTSNGYSTLWLAEAASTIGGTVTTVEFSEYKVGLASANFTSSRLAPHITLVHDDAGNFLDHALQSAFDFIFLDSDRKAYPSWWPKLHRVLRPGGLLVVDNAISHPEQIAPFSAMVKAEPQYATCLVPVGHGEFLAVKALS